MKKVMKILGITIFAIASVCGGSYLTSKNSPWTIINSKKDNTNLASVFVPFQFQSGSIKSDFDLTDAEEKYRFNSKVVRLKAKVAEKAKAYKAFQFQSGSIKRICMA